jgi:hypothetical protein
MKQCLCEVGQKIGPGPPLRHVEAIPPAQGTPEVTLKGFRQHTELHGLCVESIPPAQGSSRNTDHCLFQKFTPSIVTFFHKGTNEMVP